MGRERNKNICKILEHHHHPYIKKHFSYLREWGQGMSYELFFIKGAHRPQLPLL